MRPPSLILAASLVGGLVPLSLAVTSARAEGRANRADVISVDEIKPGMKGYGLTVFEGTRPERFDVEVIDVLKNFRPRQELILVKTMHPRLEVAKVVAGMSGSPIYLNGKMAGAYAYGWTFGAEPIAGVTPIRNMLDDLERPLPKLINGWPIELLPKAPGVKQALAPMGAKHRFSGPLLGYDVNEHSRQIAASSAFVGSSDRVPLRPLATPVLVGGMSQESVSMAGELLAPLGLEPLQAGGGGGTEPDAPMRYEDGGAIGVQLIRGDMSAMGLGTVTRVEGDRLVAFGHPMMNGGVTALPTAVGRVLWFLASGYRSFKIGMPVRPVGALVNDRQASIVVSHSAKAPVIPVSVRIRGAQGAPYVNWNFEVAHEKFMAPSFLAVAIGNAIQTTAADKQDVSWNAHSKVDIEGYGSIELEDFGVSVGGTPDPREFSRSNLVGAVGAVLNNPWKPARVSGASVDIELRYAREILRLRGAEVLESEVDAGGTARIRLTLVPFAGATSTRVVRVPIPKHLAGKTVRIQIKPGYQVEKEKSAPDDLSDLIANLEDDIYPPKSIVVSYQAGGGVAFKGRIAKHLPPGALDMIRPDTTTVAPQPFETHERHVIQLPEFVTGSDTVMIQVRPVLR